MLSPPALSKRDFFSFDCPQYFDFDLISDDDDVDETSTPVSIENSSNLSWFNVPHAGHERRKRRKSSKKKKKKKRSNCRTTMHLSSIVDSLTLLKQQQSDKKRLTPNKLLERYNIKRSQFHIEPITRLHSPFSKSKGDALTRLQHRLERQQRLTKRRPASRKS
mmetsp:Transcript_2254/g.3268  ORF Transcript_2254/g.3268 Transcript_2254/m.3268 type:complete len:163 (-) Transcript_2254:841-1329(-)